VFARVFSVLTRVLLESSDGHSGVLDGSPCFAMWLLWFTKVSMVFLCCF